MDGERASRSVRYSCGFKFPLAAAEDRVRAPMVLHTRPVVADHAPNNSRQLVWFRADLFAGYLRDHAASRGIEIACS
jgi:hypothetical protein